MTGVSRLSGFAPVFRRFSTARTSAATVTWADSSKLYEPESHKWDTNFDHRGQAFPKNVFVVEGGPRISTPEHPRIVRHSLMDASYGHSLRDPPYHYQPQPPTAAGVQTRRFGSAGVAQTAKAVTKTVPDISHDIYLSDDKQWDSTSSHARLSRFPRNVSVVEGGPRVSTAEFPSILRHSLMDPGYSLREPAYTFQHQPKHG